MKNIILICVFSIINFFAWNYLGILLLINISILFHLINHNIYKKGITFFIIFFCVFLAYNISATFWLFQVNVKDGIMAILANTFLMSVTTQLVYILKIKYNIPLYSFIFFWLLLEILHNNWALSWNWLNFGNVLGNQPYLAQWYSIVGVFGGSVWFLITGYYLHLVIEKKKQKRTLIGLSTPLAYSLLLYIILPVNRNNPINVMSYKPNYTFKDNFSNYKKTKKLFHETKELIQKAEYLITPEVFYTNTHLSEINFGKLKIYLNLLIKQNKSLKIVLGTELINSNKDKFNCIVFKDSNRLLIKTKKKYVPLREYTPLILNLVNKKSYFKKSYDDNTNEIIHNYKVFPLICYEALFSSFVGKYSNNSEIIFLLSSEEFLNNSYFGKNQYLNMIRLRAIENNKNILKCSTKNGISCIINEKGDIVKYMEEGAELSKLYKIKQKSIFQILSSIL